MYLPFAALVCLQILCLIDCLRNQRDLHWLWLVWVVPVFGVIAYWYYFKWPGSQLEYALCRRGSEKRRIEQLEATAGNVGNAVNFEELGDAFWRQKQYARAEHNYRLALEKDAKLRDARARLGYCLCAQGKPADGWPLIEGVMKENREHDDEHLLHFAGRCRHALGDLAGARQYYEEFLTRHSYYDAQLELAEVCAAQGDKAEAKRLCEEIMSDLKLSPPYVRRRKGHFAGKAKRVLRRIQRG